jgi:tetratricopeptide (TPR) repeat protein
MSYINDALRKVQKEKESRYVVYGHIVSASGKKTEPVQKWLSVIGISAVFFFAAGMIIFLYGPGDKKVPATRISEPSMAASTVVAGHRPEGNTKVEFLPQGTTAQFRTKQETDESKALFAQALKLQHEGKLKEAKRLYREVIKIDQNNVQAFNNLGVIHMSQKRYKWAIKRFNDAINVKHNYPDAHYNLACLYAQKNDAAQSLLYLKNAIRYNPEVRHWAENDGDLQTMADLPEFKKLLEKQ